MGAINTDFYGSTYYTPTNAPFKLANFATDATLNNSRLQIAIDSGRYEAGTLLDTSIATHGIPTRTDGGHTYNTLYDISAVNVFLNADNCIKGVIPTGATVPIIWRFNYRTSGSASTSIMYNLYDDMVLNAPARSATWDLYRFSPIVSADFKKFMMCICVLVFDGTVGVTGSVSRSAAMDLRAYLSLEKRFDGNTKTAREYYPYISQIFLVPAYGSTWTTFAPYTSIGNTAGCKPNYLFNFSCAKSEGGSPVDDNYDNAVLYSAVSYMDGIPLSGAFIGYTYNDDTAYNTLSVPSENTACMLLFGMLGGNGTSYGVAAQEPSGTPLNGYLHTVLGASHIKLVKTGTYTGFGYWEDMPSHSDDIREAVYKMCSYLGCIFSPSVYGDINTADRYIGVLNDDGVATGTYQIITDSDFDDFPQTATDDFIADTPFIPGSADPNTYSDVTELRARTFKTSNAFNSVYAVNYDLYMLKYYLYDVVAPTSTEDNNRHKFLNVNPIDSIVSLMFYPIDFTEHFHGGYNQVVMGNQPITYTIGGQSYQFAGYQPAASDKMQLILDLGSVIYFPHFGDFRDYEPYSSAELIIPYHGSLSISPAEFMGHSIGVKCVVDLATGSSIAYIYRDSLIVDSINGVLGVQIPVSGIAQADYNNAAYQAAAQLNAAKITQAAGFASDAIGLVSSAVSANPLAVASSATKFLSDSAQSAVSVDMAQYNVNHVKIPYRQSGTSSSAAATAADQVARLIVRRPKMLSYDPDVYAHVNGYACLMCDTLDKFSGFTVVSDVDILGNATAEEKNMIRSLLQSGVYL